MTLSHCLNALESSGLIGLAASQPELEYVFRHVLVQEAAYASLVRADRQALHVAVGDALERAYPDRLASREIAPVLAHHFSAAGDDDRALKYFMLAGDAAYGVYANAEAIGHYTRALGIAKRGAGTGRSLPLNQLYARLGRAQELSGRHDAALRGYEEMEALARQQSDRPMMLAALVSQGQIRSTATSEFNAEQGKALSEKALRLAQELGDRGAESRMLWNLLNLYRFTHRSPQARECGERSLTLARELDLREQLAFTLNDLAHVYAATGGFERTRELLREASGLWREQGNLPMLADSLATAGLYHVFTGEYEQAVAFSDEAFEINRSIENLWGQSYSRSAVGIVYWEHGEPGRAIEVMAQSIRQGEQGSYVAAEAETRADMALVYGHLGALEHGIELARLALARAEAHVPLMRPYALAALAQLHLLNENAAEADATVKAAEVESSSMIPVFAFLVDLARCQLALAQREYERVTSLSRRLLTSLREFGVRPHVPEVLRLQGQALRATGQDESARRSLMEARGEAEALGSRRQLWPILFELSRLESGRGNAAESGALRRHAREIVEYIADHAGAPELRASFLNMPSVRAARGGA